MLVWFLHAAALLPAHAYGAATTEPGSDLIIDRAIAAHGGARLTGISTIVTEWVSDDAQVFESRRPGPPWDRARRWAAYAVAFDTDQYAEARFDSAGGYEAITGTVIAGSAAYRLDYRNRTYRREPLAFDDVISDAMAFSPLILLRWLMDHRELAEYGGREQDGASELQVLGLQHAGGSRAEVLVEAGTGRIHGLRTGFTDYDGSYVPLHYRYFDLSESNGLFYPSRVEIRARGYDAGRASLEHIGVGESIDGQLAVPEGFEETTSEPRDTRKFRLEEIADGVFFVGEGVMFQLIVEFDNFLVALDGSSGDVLRRIEAVRERIPDKPFRYVLASHHHNDHLHGLDDYARLGSTIISSPAHAATVSEYVDRRLGSRPKIVAPSDVQAIRDGNREMQILDIGPTPHSEHMLAAYLPGEKILFAADLFVLGGRRVPARPATANGLALYDWIGAQNLSVERIVDPHSPLIATLSDLRRAAGLARNGHANVRGNARAALRAWRTAGEYVR